MYDIHTSHQLITEVL